MRRYIFLAMVALAMSTIAASYVHAVERPRTFMASAQLKAACGKGGGHFYELSHGRYGCEKANCDGKGSYCSYDCQVHGGTKKCDSHTPDRQAGGFIQQILRAGAYSDRRNIKTMTNNSGSFAQQPAGARMINNSGTFRAGQPRAGGVPTTGVPSVAMPGRAAPSQGTLNMQKR